MNRKEPVWNVVGPLTKGKSRVGPGLVLLFEVRSQSPL